MGSFQMELQVDWKETAVGWNTGRSGFSNWVAVGSEPARPPHLPMTERSLRHLGSGVGVGTVTVWVNRMWCQVVQFLVRQAGTRGSLLECLHLGKRLLQEQMQRNYNGLKIAVGRHSWG